MAENCSILTSGLVGPMINLLGTYASHGRQRKATIRMCLCNVYDRQVPMDVMLDPSPQPAGNSADGNSAILQPRLGGTRHCVRPVS